MTVSTIASIAANISRTSGNTSAKAASMFNSLVSAPSSNATTTDSTNLTTALNLQNQVLQLRVASQNIAHSSSLLAAAEEGANNIVKDMGRLKDIVARAALDIPDNERQLLQSEFDVLMARINRISKGAKFNNEALLDGSSPQLKIASENKNIKDLSIGSMTTDALFKGKLPSIATPAAAKASEAIVKEAVAYANTQLENIRKLQEGLDFASSTLQSAIQNQDAARSTLDDADLIGQLLGGSNSVQNNDISSVLAQTSRMPGNLLGLLSE